MNKRMAERRIFLANPRTVFFPRTDKIHSQITSRVIEQSIIVLPDCLLRIDSTPPNIYIEYNSREKTISDVASGLLISSVSSIPFKNILTP
jgi:hypothetical protein